MNALSTHSNKHSSNKKEWVNHPQHYGGDTTYEVIKVLEAWDLDKDFCLGNSVKYIARASKKNQEKEIEDLEKAAWYLNRKIENLKKSTQNKSIKPRK